MGGGGTRARDGTGKMQKGIRSEKYIFSVICRFSLVMVVCIFDTSYAAFSCLILVISADRAWIMVQHVSRSNIQRIHL